MVCKNRTFKSICFSLLLFFLILMHGCVSTVNYDDYPWISDRFSFQRDGKVLEAIIKCENNSYITRVVTFDLYNFNWSYDEIGALVEWGRNHGFDLNSNSPVDWHDTGFWGGKSGGKTLFIVCNMLSVMDGFEPVYYDSTGHVITSYSFDKVYTKPTASGWFIPFDKKSTMCDVKLFDRHYSEQVKATWSKDDSTLIVQGVPINELQFTDNSFSMIQSLISVDRYYSDVDHSYSATNLQMVILRRAEPNLPFTRNGYSIPEGFIDSGNTYLPDIEIAIVSGMKESNLSLYEYFVANNLSFNYPEYIEPIIASRAVFFEDSSSLADIKCRLFANMLSEIDGLTPVYNGYSGEPLCSTSQANAWYAVHTDGWYSLMSERNYYTESIKEYLKANGIDNSVQEIFFRFR